MSEYPIYLGHSLQVKKKMTPHISLYSKCKRSDSKRNSTSKPQIIYVGFPEATITVISSLCTGKIGKNEESYYKKKKNLTRNLSPH